MIVGVADSVMFTHLGSPALAVALARGRIVAVQWPDGWRDVVGHVLHVRGAFDRLPVVEAKRNAACLLGGCLWWNATFGLPPKGPEVTKRITTPDGKIRVLTFRGHAVDPCPVCRGAT